MNTEYHHINRSQLPDLSQFGIAVEFFPQFVNTSKRLHLVDATLISFILNGERTHYIADQSVEERGVTLAITYQGQMRDIVTDHKGADVYNIYLDLNRLPVPDLTNKLRDMLHLIFVLHPAFRTEANRSIYLNVEDEKPLIHLVQSLHSEILHMKEGVEEMVTNYTKLFLGLLCRIAYENGISAAPVKGDISPAWIDKIRSHIDLHFNEAITLDDFINMTRMSKSHLCREFKKHTGYSVMGYLIERRIQAAMLRLRSSNEKIIQVAYEIGFDDPTFFNKKFKSIVGIAPSQYRKQFPAQQ